jgi:hypothetical protein
MLWIGVCGLSAIIFLVLLMWLVVRNEDIVSGPVPTEETAQPGPNGPLPDVSNSKGATPQKKAPLDR